MNVFVSDEATRLWFEADLRGERLMEVTDALNRRGLIVSLIHYELVSHLLLCSRNLCGHSEGHPDHWRRA